MKKNYLFTLAALLLGSTIANAQKPLDGYEAPSFTAPGNCGKVISLSTSGALEFRDQAILITTRQTEYLYTQKTIRILLPMVLFPVLPYPKMPQKELSICSV